jgi:hypothetical protein
MVCMPDLRKLITNQINQANFVQKTLAKAGLNQKDARTE